MSRSAASRTIELAHECVGLASSGRGEHYVAEAQVYALCAIAEAIEDLAEAVREAGGK